MAASAIRRPETHLARFTVRAMSERLARCHKCGEPEPEVVKVHNPETYDLNARATLRCSKCGETWEGLVTSPKTADLRARGVIQ